MHEFPAILARISFVGLGLSIAKNLTVLQHGTFDIYLDGDLFKVTITFREAGTGTSDPFWMEETAQQEEKTEMQ